MTATIRKKQTIHQDCRLNVDRDPGSGGSTVYAESTDGRRKTEQQSLWGAAPQSLLPCPGNCAALRYAERHAILTAQRGGQAGGDCDASCSACGGRALAVVSCLSPLTIRSRGGIPYRPPWMSWEEHDAWRVGLLQERVIAEGIRKRGRKFLPGWRAGRSRHDP